MNLHKQLMEFYAISNEIDAFFTQLAIQSGLSVSAHWTLYFIRQSENGCTQKSICKQWSMSKQTVNSALKVLNQKGMITLHPSEDDRRSKQIHLTLEGEAFAKKHLDVIFAAEEKTFMELSESSRIALIQGSKDYLNALQKNLADILQKQEYEETKRSL